MNISEIVDKLKCHYDWRQEDENCQYNSGELTEVIKAAIDELSKQLPQSATIAEPVVVERKMKVIIVTGENTDMILKYIKKVKPSNYLLFPEANQSITHYLEEIASNIKNAIEEDICLYITTHSEVIVDFIFVLIQLGGIVEKAGEDRAKIEAKRLDIPYIPLCTGEIQMITVDEKGNQARQHIIGNSLSTPYVIRKPLDKLANQCEKIGTLLFQIENQKYNNK